MYGPAGFEDYSDDDEFDFGGGGFHFSSNHIPATSPPKQSSTSAENNYKPAVDGSNNTAMGRGRGVLPSFSGRGGFPGAGRNSDSAGQGQKRLLEFFIFQSKNNQL